MGILTVPSGNFTPGALAAVTSGIEIINATWDLAGTIKGQAQSAIAAAKAEVITVIPTTVNDIIVPSAPAFTASNAYTNVTSSEVTTSGVTNPGVAAPTAISVSSVSGASVVEPVVTIADVAAVDIFSEYTTEYLALIAELANRFVSFQGTHFPDDHAFYTQAEDWLQAALASTSGLPASVQAQIWGTDQARVLADSTRIKDSVLATFAARRFPLPPGAAASAILQIDQKAQGELAESSRKIATLSVEQFKFNIEKAINCRQMAMTSAIDYIKALATAPDVTSRLVGVGYDAQSKMVGAASQFLGARTEVAKVLNQVSQFNASTSLEQQAKNAGFKLEADYKDAQLDVDAAFKTQQGTLDATFKTQQGTLDATAKNQLAAMQTSNANTQANLQIALKTMEQNYDASLKKHLALVQASTSDRDAQLKADELRLKTLLSEVQALSQMATSLLNNLHADAGLRYSVSA